MWTGLEGEPAGGGPGRGVIVHTRGWIAREKPFTRYSFSAGSDNSDGRRYTADMVIRVGLYFLALSAYFLTPLPVYSQTYTISTVAGTERVLDGTAATGVPLRSPRGVAVDPAGNVYIADRDDNRIRKVGPSGIITTVAGNGTPGFSGDRGSAARALVSGPMSTISDSAGNIYFADSGNYRVRRIAADGTITTVAGNGSAAFSGDGGPATAAGMRPTAIALDSQGNLYIADSYNYRVRKVTSSGVISTLAGTGAFTASATVNVPATNALIGFIAAIAVDTKGNVYLADVTSAYVLRVDSAGMLTIFAGSGQSGYINDGIPAALQLLEPYGLAFDAVGNLYISDYNLDRIVKVDSAQMSTTAVGNKTTGFAGDGGPATGAQLNSPQALAFDVTGALYIVDIGNKRVRRVSSSTINTFAGTGIRDGGLASAAFLNQPDGVAVGGAGQLALADYGAGELRTFTVGGNIAALGTLGAPTGVTYDAAGNLYVGSLARIYKVTPAGQTTNVAGTGSAGFGGDGGSATSAAVSDPEGIALDASGNIYFCDFNNNRVRKISTNGTISTVAGNGNSVASGDGGQAISAGLSAADVVVDGQGNLLISDSINNLIRKVTPAGVISTVAGTRQPGYTGDGGPASAATLQFPGGLAMDKAGNLYIADSLNGVVRRITPGGLISTIAGAGFLSPTTGDGGPALAAQLFPSRVAVDSGGTVYVSDGLNDRVRALTPRSQTVASVTIAAGNNQSGTVGAALGQALSVKVADAGGAPVPGVTVAFTVNPAGAAALSFGSALTLGDGTARVTVKLGSTAGAFTVSASTAGAPALTFNLTANPVVSPTAPAIAPGGVVSAGLSVPAVKALSANAIATVFGVNFGAAGTAAQVGPGDLVDGRLPSNFSGVCVVVGNTKAPLFSVYPGQINFQVPAVSPGASTVQVLNKCGTAAEERSAVEPVTIQAASPEFFYFAQTASGKNPIAAVNASTGVFVGAVGLIAGANFAPAKPKDILTLYATGFGATDPGFAAGELPGGAARVTGSIQVTVGGVVLDPSQILYAGVTQNAGLYQLNIVVPDAVADGDQAVVVTIGGVASPAGAFFTVAR